MSAITQRITPFLWFDNQAEEAANFYTSIFKNSKVSAISRYTGAGAKASGQPEGTVMTVAFTLDGQNFTAINGGPVFKFTEAVSFVINCENQEEVDHFWNKLTGGGQEVQCGWLKDKFGLSWQVVPRQLAELMTGPKAGNVMQALLTMKKIEIKKLEAAGKN